MSLLRVSLFGRLDLSIGQEALAGFEARRVQELFCYLLLYRDRPHPREALANLLWEDRHTDSPTRCLRKTLWQLRTALDSRSEPLSERVLRIESDWVQFRPHADVWVDVAVGVTVGADVSGVVGRGSGVVDGDGDSTAPGVGVVLGSGEGDVVPVGSGSGVPLGITGIGVSVLAAELGSGGEVGPGVDAGRSVPAWPGVREGWAVDPAIAIVASGVGGGVSPDGEAGGMVAATTAVALLAGSAPGV